MRKNILYCHHSFSQENVKGSSNYKIIKSGRSLDLAFQLGAMTRRDCHVNNDNNSLSYVREADNKNLLAGELDISFNLTPPAPSYIRGGEKGELSYIRGGGMGIIAMTIIGLFSFNAQAECTPTPDCASIGYTETSCETISLKCPFDQTKLYCFPCDSKYQYTCSNPNEYGNGESCKGKYKSCCNTDCIVGAIYYSDKTCNSCLDNSKTPVGVVVKDNELVMSHIKRMPWGTYGTDVDTLTNITSSANAKADYNGKSNTAILVAFQTAEGLTASNSAAIYCNEYAPTGMENSKGQWYLPAVGELYSYVYGNYSTLKPVINTMGWSYFDGYVFWSSFEYDNDNAWTVRSGSERVGSNLKSNDRSVSCFLAL